MSPAGAKTADWTPSPSSPSSSMTSPAASRPHSAPPATTNRQRDRIAQQARLASSRSHRAETLARPHSRKQARGRRQRGRPPSYEAGADRTRGRRPHRSDSGSRGFPVSRSLSGGACGRDGPACSGEVRPREYRGCPGLQPRAGRLLTTSAGRRGRESVVCSLCAVLRAAPVQADERTCHHGGTAPTEDGNTATCVIANTGSTLRGLCPGLTASR
jgi:hypothetical protein